MKAKLLLSSLLSFYFYLLSSQVPQGFNYQAIARDGSGNPILNTPLPVTITIKSDSLGGTIFWEELHSSVTTNGFGLFTIVVGKGTRLVSSTVATFKDINWSVTPKFIMTQILYQSELKNMGSSRFQSVPYSLVAGELAGSLDKLEVAGKTTALDEALFEVKNKDGQTIFAVYNEGVRIYVDDAAKSPKGGFAIGGFDKIKGTNQDYFTVNRDSVRVYLDTISVKSNKGGFSIGGFDKTKGSGQDYFVVNTDSIRAYIDTNPVKAKKGGFAIGGFDLAKGGNEEYLRVTRDSTRVYLNNTVNKGKKGGFAIGGFDLAKDAGNEYLSVTMDSVKVSKSLLIPRLTTNERDNLPFTPGEALIIFNTTEGCMQIFKNSVWSNIWCFNCAPDFIIQPVDKTICSGENAVFFVSATGTNLNYQWQQSTDNGITWNNISNGGSTPAYSGAKGYKLTLSNVPVGHHNNRYRCVVAGSCLPNVTSNAVTLNVCSTPPVITLQPTNQQLSTGCTANFSITSPGYGVSYKWQQSIDGGSIWTNISNGGSSPAFSGSTASTLSLSNVPLVYNNYKYRCVVSNTCGADATSAAASLTINILPDITIQPENKMVYAGQNTSFIITTSGSDYSYQWQVSINGGDTWSIITNGGSNPAYSGAMTSILNITNVPLVYNNYKYRCLVSHYCRPDAISDAASLLVLNIDPVTDIDGNIYNTVGIGSQLWMAENLKTTKYRNGDLIGTTIPAEKGIFLEEAPKYQWAYDGNESYVTTYGRLYTWYTVTDSRNVCPTGWHVPNDIEWSTLIEYLRNWGYGYMGDINKFAKSLASTWGWTASSNAGTPGNDQTSNNSSGFTGLPGGTRSSGGTFESLGTTGNWLITTWMDAAVLYYESSQQSFRGGKKEGYSVRCLKD
jgi:uncharacterized protein (TIGR02145 family)